VIVINKVVKEGYKVVTALPMTIIAKSADSNTQIIMEKI